MDTEYLPDCISSPGGTIKDLMEYKGIDVQTLSSIANIDEDTILQIINGEIPIDQDIAKKLEIVFGVSSKFWITREKRFRRANERESDIKREE